VFLSRRDDEENNMIQALAVIKMKNASRMKEHS
jgi:hypothetical protein